MSFFILVESSTQAAKAKQPDYRRIADALKKQILGGKWAPGVQLPSTDKLAVTWETSYGTIHNALQVLTKQGWLERIDGSGTYVAHFENRFTCAGIYHDSDIFAREDTAFSRALHTCLLEQLATLGKEALVFVDSRPTNKQVPLLPALADAILHRRIQCLIAPTLNEFDYIALTRVNLPSAFSTTRNGIHEISLDWEVFLKGAVKALVRQGCRSVGLISSMLPPSHPEIKDPADNFYPIFRQAVRDDGAVTRESWIRKPAKWTPNLDLELFGYKQFKKLWDLGEKPDGLIVWPDSVVRGAITAILDTGRPAVTRHTKFVFHRNSRVRLLCPFPVTWGVTDEAIMAAEFIKMVQKQFNGEKVSSVALPYTFSSHNGISER